MEHLLFCNLLGWSMVSFAKWSRLNRKLEVKILRVMFPLNLHSHPPTLPATPSGRCTSGVSTPLVFDRMLSKYCVFSKNSRKFSNSPSPALGCYWLYKKLVANRSDGTLSLLCLRALEVSYSDVGEGRAAVNYEKHNFS